ncbi:M20 family metallopeptidase [Gammaproteobacteria bacterium]|nr:M20 family metallopeptidase [Gammaproteobacteria bacterium]
MINFKNDAKKKLNEIKKDIINLSHTIHKTPELAFKEVNAAANIIEILKKSNFNIEEGICDLPTAFKATIGNGSLHIAICAEYDALPGIGHACGHNIIAASAVGSAIALSEFVNELDLTISVIGTPAEESGGGKILMLERGGFNGIHAAMMIHPAPVDMICPSIIACSDIEVRFYGKESHASSSPELGINAQDALTISQISIGLLRQHIISFDRIHGTPLIVGKAPNVIPHYVTARYLIRSSTLKELKSLQKRVIACFEAGAIATGCKFKIIEKELPYANMIHDTDLAKLYKQNAESLGRVFIDDLSNAKPKTFIEKIFLFLLRQAGISGKDLEPMLKRFPGSTDMGNISQTIPSIHPMIGIQSMPAVNHQLEFTKACIEPPADDAVIDGALSMAYTAIDIANNKSLKHRLCKK